DSGLRILREISLTCPEHVSPRCSVSTMWSKIRFCSSVSFFEQILFKDSSKIAEGVILFFPFLFLLIFGFVFGYLSEKANTFVTADTLVQFLPSVGY
ncbi:MAG: hypothetical protein QW748_01945, partial [Candidatus Methanomethylicaceae archaeon]